MTTQLARNVRSNALPRNTPQAQTGEHKDIPTCFSVFSLLAAMSLAGSARQVITLADSRPGVGIEGTADILAANNAYVQARQTCCQLPSRTRHLPNSHKKD